jgi:hypothetical protein
MKGALKILDLFGEKPIIVACYEKNWALKCTHIGIDPQLINVDCKKHSH